MITFACLVPHAPLLIPEVGQDNLQHLKETVEAYRFLEAELYVAKPEIIILLSSHANTPGETFTINQRPMLKVNFKRFGDLVTNLEFKNEISLGYKIKEACETALPVNLNAEEQVTYSSGVPLYYLTQHLPQVKIVVINYSTLTPEVHLKFGEIIKEQIDSYGQRVALVASGDLSHRLHQDSPAGFSPRGQEFDQKIINLLANRDLEGLIKLDSELVKEAGECAWRSILILLSTIKELDYTPVKLSYQAPFGIGYLVEQFKIR
ncbi:MAG: AmmeMemoRadiSam system protein B [Patescibacteria group bacterium]